MNEQCRLISESQWREYQELATKCNRLEEVVEECRKYIETEQKMLVKCSPHYKKVMEELLSKIDEVLK